MGSTYADGWNAKAIQKGYNLSTGPKLVVLSGPWDSMAEDSDMMEYEVSLSEVVAEALVEIRKPSVGDYGGEVMVDTMEVDFDRRRSSIVTILPDTNVMISFLGLLDAFVRFLSLCPDLSVDILLPGIVMSELDGLRKAAGRSCQTQAQDANRWAANELAKKQLVRGQRDSATTAPGKSWRRYYYETGKENPDGYIIDCAHFDRSQVPGGVSIVLTLDQNCAAQCLSNGLLVISPHKSWTLETLVSEVCRQTSLNFLPQHQAVIQHLEPSLQSNPTTKTTDNRNGGPKPRSHTKSQSGSSVPDWANTPSGARVLRSSTKSQKERPRSAHVSETNSSLPSNTSNRSLAGMDVDDHGESVYRPHPYHVPQPVQVPRDPRDVLQEQLRSYLQSVLPTLLESSIRMHNRPPSPRQVDLTQSIHAPGGSRPMKGKGKQKDVLQKKKMRALPPVDSTVWKEWSIQECVLFLAEYPPPSPPNSPASSRPTTPTNPPPNHSTMNSIDNALQSLSALVRTDRRGREFGRGDWDRACVGFGHLCPEAKESFERAVLECFDASV